MDYVAYRQEAFWRSAIFQNLRRRRQPDQPGQGSAFGDLVQKQALFCLQANQTWLRSAKEFFFCGGAGRSQFRHSSIKYLPTHALCCPLCSLINNTRMTSFLKEWHCLKDKTDDLFEKFDLMWSDNARNDGTKPLVVYI